MHKGTVFYKSYLTGDYEKLFDYNFVDKITLVGPDKCVQKWEFIIYSPNKYIEAPKGNFVAKCWCDTCNKVLFETTCAKLGLITYMDGGKTGKLPSKAKVELSVGC